MTEKARDAISRIPPTTDPREFFREHRERGPGQFRFTLADVAEAAGQTLTTTRMRLRLKEDTPKQVAYYIVRALSDKSRKLSIEEVERIIGRDVDLWENRWPKFDLYWCGEPDCSHVLFEPGVCAAHGGTKTPSMTLQKGYFTVRVGQKYEPLHRFICGTVRAEHLDGNTLNNRAENLKPVTSRFKRREWTYGYRELADLFGLSEDGVRQATARKILNPESLQSVCCFWASGMEEFIED